MDILSRPHLSPDHCIAYGSNPSQIGHLWLPEREDRPLSPLVVFFHGGWWKSKHGLGYAGYLCSAMKKEGIACWSVEYRRVGGTGGGWPFTFHDVAAGLDFVVSLARTYPLDLARVITMGHSAGGHLAFWCAGRHHLAPQTELYLGEQKVALVGSIALAGAVDLASTIALAGNGQFAHDQQEVEDLMGGSPLTQPERYQQGDPAAMLPFHVPQILIQGTEDDQIPPDLPMLWAERAGGLGDAIIVKIIPGAGHLDVVDPESAAWPTVLDCVKGFLI